MGKRRCCAEAVSRCFRCCLVKQQDQQSRELMRSLCTFASGEALITASALFCCCPFCGLISHTAADFHQPFKNLLMPAFSVPQVWLELARLLRVEERILNYFLFIGNGFRESFNYLKFQRTKISLISVNDIWFLLMNSFEDALSYYWTSSHTEQYAHLSPLLFLVGTGAITFFTSFTSILDCIEQLNWKNNLFDWRN